MFVFFVVPANNQYECMENTVDPGSVGINLSVELLVSFLSAELWLSCFLISLCSHLSNLVLSVASSLFRRRPHSAVASRVAWGWSPH